MSRNVEVLKSALAQYWGDRVGVDSLAHFLAARGVLAVDALTDSQCHDVVLMVGAVERVDYPSAKLLIHDMRAALRRCATGEGET